MLPREMGRYTPAPPQALVVKIGVGLAERSQRRVEDGGLGWIKFGLDSYVDPDSLTLSLGRYKSHCTGLHCGYVENKMQCLESRPDSYGTLWLVRRSG